MTITLNNRTETFERDQLSVAELLRIKNFTFRMLVIKINGNLVQKEAYASTMIGNGDNVMVLHLISGG